MKSNLPTNAQASVLIPTRKRSKNIKRIVDELSPYLNNEKIELILGIDLDDDSYDLSSICNECKNILIVRTPVTKYLSNIYNILVNYASTNIVGYFADDVTFLNLSGFDDVIEFFKTNKNFLYSFNTDDLTTHGFIDKRAIQCIGFLFPPYLEHGYSDRYVEQLYGGVNKKFINSSINFYKHLHPLHVGSTTPWDETYQIKSRDRDEEGRLADERDRLVFDHYVSNYLKLHQQAIQ